MLYMFDDAIKKLPSMVIAMSDCKGARRAIQSTRPHCFEILLKTGIIQMAAPDEYVASEWLQTLVQAASGLFELQERNKTLGCTLVITSNHLITLREDFSSPLRRLNSSTIQPTPVAVTQTPYQRLQVKESNSRKMSISTNSDIFNDVISCVDSCSFFVNTNFCFHFSVVDLLKLQHTNANVCGELKS